MKIDVLDHGYVECIEPWGRGRDGVMAASIDGQTILNFDYEVGIVEAARQSTQGAFRGWDPAPCDCDTETKMHRQTCNSVKNPGDRKLLAFLMSKHHDTPFEFAGMVIEVQAPIFVFREWHRHRTQSYNEMSARYAPLPDLYFTPERGNVIDRGHAATHNKQASGVAPFNAHYVDAWLANVDHAWKQLEQIYQEALANGIPKELARITMPVGHYTRMRAHANLRNWLAFLTLRNDPAAQEEIRMFARAVDQIIQVNFPQTWALFHGISA